MGAVLGGILTALLDMQPAGFQMCTEFPASSVPQLEWLQPAVPRPLPLRLKQATCGSHAPYVSGFYKEIGKGDILFW